MYTAKVYFTKDVEHDNYDKGCTGSIQLVHTETFYVDFADTDDLIQGLANWANERFDVSFEDMHENLENGCEDNRFDYAQGENAEGNKFELSETHPDGYCADYRFYIDEVYAKVNYDFIKGDVI